MLYLVPHGLTLRLVQDSGLLARLRDHGLSPVLTGPPDLVAAGPHLSPEWSAVHPEPAADTQPWATSDQWVRMLTQPLRGSPGLASKLGRWRTSGQRRQRARSQVITALNPITSKPRLAHGLLAAQRLRVGRHTEGWDDLLDRVDPAVVVSGAPFRGNDSAALLSAQRRGIPTVGHIINWDHVTNQGCPVAMPDQLLSWGAGMSAQIERVYRCAPEIITATGPLQAAVLQRGAALSRSEVLGLVGLPDPSRYLLFALSLPFHAPTEIDVARWVADRAEREDDLYVVIRPHPQSLAGFTAASEAWRQKLADLTEHPRVRISTPLLAREQDDAWAMQSDDSLHYAGLLRNAVGCLTSGSTAGVESMMCGRPPILTFFDAEGTPAAGGSSAANSANYPHLRAFIDLPTVGRADSFDELEPLIARALRDDPADADARRAVLDAYLVPEPERSPERVAGAIATIRARTGSTSRR